MEKRFGYWRFGNWVLFGIWILVLGISALAVGCGQQQAAEPTPAPSTPAASGPSTIVRGSSSTTTTAGLSLAARAQAVLATAEVTIGVCTKDSDAITTVATGTTDASGNYTINVPTASLEQYKSTNGYVPNLFITISKEGVVIGCVIPSCSPEANRQNFAPPANPGAYRKGKIALRVFKKGSDPKSFNFSENIDQQFSDDTMKSYNDTDLDKMAGSVKDTHESEDEIAVALGISAETFALLRQKGFELHRTYIEPIFQAKQGHNRELVDRAFGSMEAEVVVYAKVIGITGQQLSDLRAMKNQQMQGKLKRDLGESDPAYGEAMRRMKGTKLISLLRAQFEAAKTLAITASLGATTTFATSTPETYAAFQAAIDPLVARISDLLSSTTVEGSVIPGVARVDFIDRYIYPPVEEAPQGDMSNPDFQASFEAWNATYRLKRIMIFFIHTFFSAQERGSLFTTMRNTLDTIYQNRMNNTSSDYYMGGNFFETATVAQIEAKLAAFNTALDDAVDNSATLTSLLNGRFAAADIRAIKKALRVIMVPPGKF